MDHAIYAKALEVMVNPINQDLHNFINLRMGGFHACCIFLAVIAKRFSAAGLKDVIIETNLAGPGAVESVLKGKQYNRGIRVVKILYEALFWIKIEAFEELLAENHNTNDLVEFMESSQLAVLIKDRNTETMTASMEKIEHLFLLHDKFDEQIRLNNLGPMACNEPHNSYHNVRFQV